MESRTAIGLAVAHAAGGTEDSVEDLTDDPVNNASERVGPGSIGLHALGAGLDRDDGAETAHALTEFMPDLIRHAHILMRNPGDAQDLVQDTLERAMQSLHKLRPGSNLRAWLYTILAHRACDVHRCQKRRTHEVSDVDELPSAPAPDPEARWALVTSEQLTDAIARLPKRFREIYELHELHRRPYQSIAVEQGLPINTVASRLRRAREKLRDLLTTELDKNGGES